MENDRAPVLKQENTARLICLAMALSLTALGFVCAPPGEIVSGLAAFALSRDVLITDYFALAGVGPAFVNAGLVMLLSMLLVRLCRARYTGNIVAALFLMSGFALFGKNPLNIPPFFLGVWLYTRYKKLPMQNHVPAALYSTTLAPVVSELLCAASLPTPLRVVLAYGAGTAVGLIVVPLAEQLVRGHRGYVLFNYGFVCGFLAFVVTAINKSLHLQIDTVGHLWYHGRDPRVLWFVLGLSALLLVLGLWLSGWKLRDCIRLMRHYGYAPNDFISLDGIGPTAANMGLTGLLCTGYILMIGGDLSGPVVGAIFTAIGFGASGAHPRGFLPVMAGVWLFSQFSLNTAAAPGVQLAALFGAVALSPVGGEFGPLTGLLAGCLHNAAVSVTGSLTSGFNLYNNGFAAGIVAMLMVTVLHAFPLSRSGRRWTFYLRGFYLGRTRLRAYEEQLRLEREEKA